MFPCRSLDTNDDYAHDVHVAQFPVTRMLACCFRPLVWLVTAVYLLDGVLAGAAHVHGPVCEEGACQSAEASEHSHASCGHGHSHGPEKSAAPAKDAPVHHEHQDCAACRYSTLSAPPPALAVLPELVAEVEFVPVLVPSRPITRLVSRCRSRAPPVVA